MFDEIPAIECEEIYIEPNSVLFTFTDGLVEIENEQEEAYEIENVIEELHKNYSISMHALNECIFKKIKAFKGSMPYIDDTAVLSIRFI